MALTPEQRAENSRTNGSFSRGPATAYGKWRSSQNAIKTTLRARVFVAPHEEQTIRQRAEEWRDRYNPHSPAAVQALLECARASVLADRCENYRDATIEEQLRQCQRNRKRREGRRLKKLTQAMSEDNLEACDELMSWAPGLRFLIKVHEEIAGSIRSRGYLVEKDLRAVCRAQGFRPEREVIRHRPWLYLLHVRSLGANPGTNSAELEEWLEPANRPAALFHAAREELLPGTPELCREKMLAMIAEKTAELRAEAARLEAEEEEPDIQDERARATVLSEKDARRVGRSRAEATAVMQRNLKTLFQVLASDAAAEAAATRNGPEKAPGTETEKEKHDREPGDAVGAGPGGRADRSDADGHGGEPRATDRPETPAEGTEKGVPRSPNDPAQTAEASFQGVVASGSSGVVPAPESVRPFAVLAGTTASGGRDGEAVAEKASKLPVVVTARGDAGGGMALLLVLLAVLIGFVARGAWGLESAAGSGGRGSRFGFPLLPGCEARRGDLKAKRQQGIALRGGSGESRIMDGVNVSFSRSRMGGGRGLRPEWGRPGGGTEKEVRSVGIRAAVRQELSSRSVSVPDLEEDDGLGARLRRVLRALDDRFPELSHWLGGRLDIEVPAIAVSVAVHGLFLLVLATAGYAVHAAPRQEFQSQVMDKAVTNELTHSDFQDLDQGPDPPALTPAAGSFSPNLASMVSSPPDAAVAAGVSGTAPAAALELASVDVRRATDVAVPTAAMLGQSVSIKGNGAEHVGGVEGAVDRVATEVLRRLEQGRTLVIWAFDASGSLQEERERLSKHIDAVYAHIAQSDEQGLTRDGGLLTMVVAFGHDRKAMTPEPTADKEAIISAIGAVPLDTTGVETTFQTVADVVKRWGRYKDAEGRTYHAMVIVVTDEVGDDETHLEEAIEVASKAKVPVYVLGSQAIFGRAEGYMDYTDPKTKQVYRHLPVRQGPESVMLEQIRMPFWYEGPQYEVLDAGFGPYALSRLAGATGGIYFVTRLGERRMGFDPVMMREYKPDWISRNQYEANLGKDPIRQAVIESALLTQQKLPGQPTLRFPAADGPEFKEAMAKAQEVAARTAYTVDAALEPIMRVAKQRDHETSRRWQAHFDLILGRLLAMKIRCYEYNWACAKMKKDAPKFQNTDSNGWRLVPDEEIHYSDKAAAAANEAKALLKRVVDEHPGTPWALLAQRELKDPFGFKWVETKVSPNMREKAGAEAKKKKAMPKPAATKPAELPKL